MERIIERILDFATAHPDIAAAEDSGGVTTYGRLADQCACVSAALTGAGFQDGDAAAVYVPQSRHIIAGMVSAVWAGGVYVPLEAQHPVQRLESILADCGARAILTERALWESRPLNAPGAQVIFLDEQDQPPAQVLPPRQLPDDAPGMLLYTSGTSGRPRGVLHSRKFLAYYDGRMTMEGVKKAYSTVRTCVISSFSFIATQSSLWRMILQGGTVCIAPEEARQDLASLYRYIQKNRIQ